MSNMKMVCYIRRKQMQMPNGNPFVQGAFRNESETTMTATW